VAFNPLPSLCVLILAGALALSACGGDDDKNPGTTGTSSGPSPDVKLQIGVRALKPGGGVPDFKQAARAAAGDTIQVDVRVAKGERVPAGASVEIQIPRGPASTLKLTAAPRGRQGGAAAKLRAPAGRRIALTAFRYVCFIPPNSSCHIDQGQQTGRGYRVVAPAPPSGRAILLALQVNAGK
jgi:hypothetical protein